MNLIENTLLKKKQQYRIQIRRNHITQMFNKRRTVIMKQWQQNSSLNYNQFRGLDFSSIKDIELQLKQSLQAEDIQKLLKIVKNLIDQLKQNNNKQKKIQIIEVFILKSHIPELLIKVHSQLLYVQENFIKKKQQCQVSIITVFAYLSRCQSFTGERFINLEIIEMLSCWFVSNLKISINVLEIFTNMLKYNDVFKRSWNANILHHALDLITPKTANQISFQDSLTWFLIVFLDKSLQFTNIKYDPTDLILIFQFCHKIISNFYSYLYEQYKSSILIHAIQITKILSVQLKIDRNINLSPYIDILLSNNITSEIGRESVQSILCIIGHLVFLNDNYGILLVTNPRFLISINKQRIVHKHIWLQIMANLATIKSLHKYLRDLALDIIDMFEYEEDMSNRKLLFRFLMNWYIIKNFRLQQQQIQLIINFSLKNKIPHELNHEQDMFWYQILNNNHNLLNQNEKIIPKYIFENQEYYQTREYLRTINFQSD